MEFQDLCPNCSSDLNNFDNVLFTEESTIFKGHNVYMLCKKCGYVMVYNKDRDLIFNIDKYKDDKEVLMEIEKLISEVDSHYTLNLEEEELTEPYVPEEPFICEGICDSCNGCNQILEEEPVMEKLREEEVQEQQQEVQEEFNPEMIKDSYLVVQNQTGMAQLVRLEEMQFIPDLQNCTIFALEEVTLEPVVSFKVHKK